MLLYNFQFDQKYSCRNSLVKLTFDTHPARISETCLTFYQISDLSSIYNKVPSTNFSMGGLRIVGSSCDSFLSLLQDVNFDKLGQKRIVTKPINIAIKATYFIFCQRNKPWNNPEFLNM